MFIEFKVTGRLKTRGVITRPRCGVRDRDG